MMSCQALLDQTPFAGSEAIPNETATTEPIPRIGPIVVPPTATALPVQSQSTAITLTLWTMERFSDQNNLIASQIAQFEQVYPNIKVDVVLKRTAGQASALNFLRSSQIVAPSILPDIVVLHTNDLASAWRGKLIQPLDALLAPELVDDLIPAAKRIVTVDESLAGVPFEMDVEHMVYHTGRVITMPVVWTDVLSDINHYQFQANGQNGLLNDTLIVQYLASGARLTDDQGQPIIDEAVLLALLHYYQDLVSSGILNPEAVNTTYASQIWDFYLDDALDAVHINAHRYLSDQRLLADTQPGPIPSQHGAVLGIGHGWALALVTTDEARQTAAVQFISALLQTDNNKNWADQAAVIPTRNTVLEQLREEGVYWQFLESYLNQVEPIPRFNGFDQLSRILLIAIQQVINGEATPDEATVTATEALNQLTQ